MQRMDVEVCVLVRVKVMIATCSDDSKIHTQNKIKPNKTKQQPITNTCTKKNHAHMCRYSHEHQIMIAVHTGSCGAIQNPCVHLFVNQLPGDNMHRYQNNWCKQSQNKTNPV